MYLRFIVQYIMDSNLSKKELYGNALKCRKCNGPVKQVSFGLMVIELLIFFETITETTLNTCF